MFSMAFNDKIRHDFMADHSRSAKLVSNKYKANFCRIILLPVV